MKLIIGLALSLLCTSIQAQFSQQFRGTVTDQVLQQPLAGATVTIYPLEKSVITDGEGVFRFNNIPVGIYHLRISYAGFKEGSADNISVNSGKETVINISLEAIIRTETEVVIKANSKKNNSQRSTIIG